MIKLNNIHAALSAAKNFTATNDMRVYLNGILVHFDEDGDPTHVTASDGCAGICIGSQPAYWDENFVIIHKAILNDVLKASKDCKVCKVSSKSISFDSEEFHLTILYNRYPNIYQVIPSRGRYDELRRDGITLNFDYLAKFAKARKALIASVPTREKVGFQWHMGFGATNEGVRVELKRTRTTALNYEVDNAVGIVMPIRTIK